MRHLIRFLSIAAVFGLAACGSPENLGPFYEAYDRDYRQKHAFAEHQVPRDGFKLYAREFGAAHRGKGPTIFLMHGFPDSLHLYDLVAPRLARSRHVVSFDFLGWGRSDKPADHRYDVASLRRDIDAVVDHFKVKEMVFVVHDSSGQPGIDWALDNEDRIAGLVLLNTYYSPIAALKPPEAIARFSEDGWWRDIQVFGAMRSDSLWQSGVMEQLGKFTQSDEVRRVQVRVFAHQALGIRPAFFGLNRVLRAEVAKRAKSVPRLKAFRKPVRIVFGAGDPYLNADVGRAFHTLFPGSELFLVDDAMHYVQLDQPEEVAALVLGLPGGNKE